VRISSNPSLRTIQETLRARAICVREILFAHLCILLIESACLFRPCG